MTIMSIAFSMVKEVHAKVLHANLATLDPSQRPGLMSGEIIVLDPMELARRMNCFPLSPTQCS